MENKLFDSKFILLHWNSLINGNICCSHATSSTLEVAILGDPGAIVEITADDMDRSDHSEHTEPQRWAAAQDYHITWEFQLFLQKTNRIQNEVNVSSKICSQLSILFWKKTTDRLTLVKN